MNIHTKIISRFNVVKIKFRYLILLILLMQLASHFIGYQFFKTNNV
jgi:hypothetical protein